MAQHETVAARQGFSLPPHRVQWWLEMHATGLSASVLPVDASLGSTVGSVCMRHHSSAAEYACSSSWQRCCVVAQQSQSMFYWM
jgi:hypothetical protein